MKHEGTHVVFYVAATDVPREQRTRQYEAPVHYATCPCCGSVAPRRYMGAVCSWCFVHGHGGAALAEGGGR